MGSGDAMNASESARLHQIQLQRSYYANTAHRYESMHLHEDDEHSFALRFMISVVRHLGIKSVLDIGSGTGRCLAQIVREMPDVAVVGVEPSAQLREVGYSKGLTETQLIDGDAMKLTFPDHSFDLVCEFGALHHIPLPSRAVAEMLRVSRKAIFISDANNFGQGRRLSRLLKQAVNAFGLWPLADFIKTRGKRYTISDGDGLAYSYSVFNNYQQIREKCESIHLLNTTDAGPDIYRSASHVALLGIIRRIQTAAPAPQ